MASTMAFGISAGARLVSMVLFLVAVIAAAGSVEAGSVTVSWTAPTTNANGTRLTDLAGYRLYLGTTLPSCPGPSFHTVASPTATPAPGQIVSTRVKGLKAHATYFARLTSVDLSGNESACSGSANGVAPPDFTVKPTATVGFGKVALNGMVEHTFTVQNTSTATISGGASVAAPFSIVSGASFSLDPGDTQAVIVGFRPTTVGAFAANVTFTAGGDTVSRGVSGSAKKGGGASSVRLSVTKNGTGAGKVTSSPAGITCGAACTAAVAAGTSIALTASPVAGSVFTGWSGACSGSATCVVTMTTDTATTATFNTAPPAVRPAPSASSLTPAAVVAGHAGLTLTVNGSGFAGSSVVRWNGVARATTFVSAKQLRATISATDLASPRSVAVSVVTPSPGGGTSGNVTFSITARPAKGIPLPPPDGLRVKGTTLDASGVTFTIAWGAVEDAASYRYVAAFVDGSAPQQGAVKARSLQLRIPYHAGGVAFGALVCIRSVSDAGRQSADQTCSSVWVPARPAVAGPAGAPPVLPSPPPVQEGSVG